MSLVARHVGDLPISVYAAPSYLQRAGTPAHPSEVEGSQHRVVSFIGRTRTVIPYELQRGGEKINIQGRHVLSVDDGNAYLAAGLAGLGILPLPDYMASAHLVSGELVRLFEDWRLEPMPLYLAFPPNRHVSAKLRVFMEWVVELMEVHAPVVRAVGEG